MCIYIYIYIGLSKIIIFSLVNTDLYYLLNNLCTFFIFSRIIQLYENNTQQWHNQRLFVKDMEKAKSFTATDQEEDFIFVITEFLDRDKDWQHCILCNESIGYCERIHHNLH